MDSLMRFSASGKNDKRSPRHLARLTYVWRGELLNNSRICYWIDKSWSFEDAKLGLRTPKKIMAETDVLVDALLCSATSSMNCCCLFWACYCLPLPCWTGACFFLATALAFKYFSIIGRMALWLVAPNYFMRATPASILFSTNCCRLSKREYYPMSKSMRLGLNSSGMCWTQTEMKYGKNKRISSASTKVDSRCLAASSAFYVMMVQSDLVLRYSLKIFVAYSRCSLAFLLAKSVKSKSTNVDRY